MHDPENPTMKYHQRITAAELMTISFLSGKLKIMIRKSGQNSHKRWGAKYMFITSKHHDGFCLWPTRYTDRNAMKMGPQKDILGRYFASARKYGLKVGLYYSLYEWFNPLYTGRIFLMPDS